MMGNRLQKTGSTRGRDGGDDVTLEGNEYLANLMKVEPCWDVFRPEIPRNWANIHNISINSENHEDFKSQHLYTIPFKIPKRSYCTCRIKNDVRQYVTKISVTICTMTDNNFSM